MGARNRLLCTCPDYAIQCCKAATQTPFVQVTPSPSLDDPIYPRKQRSRDAQSKRLCDPRIEHQQVFVGLFNRQVCRSSPFENFEAENVAGFAKATGPIRFDLNRSHSSMAHIAWGPNGLVHSYKEYKQKFGRP